MPGPQYGPGGWAIQYVVVEEEKPEPKRPVGRPRKDGQPAGSKSK